MRKIFIFINVLLTGISIGLGDMRKYIIMEKKFMNVCFMGEQLNVIFRFIHIGGMLF